MKRKVIDKERKTMRVRVGATKDHSGGASITHEPKALTSAAEAVPYDDTV